MRKVIYVFVFFISLFVFNDSFVQEKEIEETKMMNLVSVFADNEQKQIQLFDLEVPKKREKFYQELFDFVYGQKATAFISDVEQDSDLVNYTSGYLYTTNADVTLDNLYFMKDKTIDFQKPSNQYYSSSLKDSCLDHFDFLNKNMYKEYKGVYRLYPFSEITKTNKSRIYLYFISDDPQQMKALLEASPIAKYLSDDLENTTYSAVYAGDVDTSLSKKLLFICEAAVVLLLLCDVFHQRKEILVRRTFGMSTAYVTFKLYFKFLLGSLVCYILGLIISWFIFIGKLSAVTHSFLKLQLDGLLQFLFYTLVIYIILHGFIYFVRKAEHLKNNSKMKHLNYINLALKAIVLVLILSPLIDFVSLGMSEIKNMWHLNVHKEELRNNVYIDGIEAGSEWDAIAYAQEYFAKHGGVYQDFIVNQMENSDGDLVYDKPHIVVDFNYLKNYEIYDENGKKLTLHEDMDDVLLVPKKYKGILDLYRYADSSSYEAIFIENGMQFYNLEPSTATDYGWTIKDPIVNVINLTDAKKWNLPYMLLPYKDDRALKQILQDFENDGMQAIKLGTTARRFDNVYEMVKDNFFACIYLLVVYTIVILAFLYQNIYLYFIETKEEFALRYLHGYTFIQRHGELLVKNIAIYIIPFLYGYFSLDIGFMKLLVFLVIAILFELCAIYYLTRKLERNRIIEVMKGE